MISYLIMHVNKYSILQVAKDNLLDNMLLMLSCSLLACPLLFLLKGQPSRKLKSAFVMEKPFFPVPDSSITAL